MTELDLYLQHIPMIAEMVVRCRKMSAQQYEEWKREAVEASPDTAKEFIIKVFTVISVELERKVVQKTVSPALRGTVLPAPEPGGEVADLGKNGEIIAVTKGALLNATFPKQTNT